jgi:hypothetical protein
LESSELTQAVGSTNLVQKARDLINHDFLALQHQHLSDKLYIRAENVTGQKPGIMRGQKLSDAIKLCKKCFIQSKELYTQKVTELGTE